MRRWWLAALTLCVLGLGAGWSGLETLGVAPRQLAPYLERRAEGHNPGLVGAVRRVGAALRALDRGPDVVVEAERFWGAVRGVPSSPEAGGVRVVPVSSVDSLRAAVAAAMPGDEIRVLPGVYRIDGRGLVAQRPGTRDRPIVVRGEGKAWPLLESTVQEAIRVTAPHWRFENLALRGVCGDHAHCEHAFHVVGRAEGFVARNNRLSDFNAHFKINGEGGAFPDGGLVVSNTLTNSEVRKTANPVTPIDLVAASGWRVEENLIADFVRTGGDRVSYGAFSKGGAAGTIFARNVVVCESRLRGHPGARVGLSFGGGGSAPDACRDRRCIVEHQGGEIRDNLVIACSDEGVYLNRSADAAIVDNTLIDTAGIDLRFPETSAELSRNLVDGRVRVRDGALVRASTGNVTTATPLLYLGVHPVRRLFADASAGDLRWRADATPPGASAGARGRDLCGADGAGRRLAGAFDRFELCANRASVAGG
jgi:hypothetical protein